MSSRLGVFMSIGVVDAINATSASYKIVPMRDKYLDYLARVGAFAGGIQSVLFRRISVSLGDSMIYKQTLFNAIPEIAEHLVEVFEESLPMLSSTPIGFGGCVISIAVDDDKEPQLIIKIGTDIQEDIDFFNADDLLDEILDSELGDEIDRVFSDYDILASDFLYTLQPYKIE